jgi:hypothetical protein
MGRKILAVVVTAASALIAGCGPRPDGSVPKTPDPKSAEKSADETLRKYPNSNFPPSLVQLLAHPDRYHGEKVQVQGYLHVRFEGTAIYLSREDAEYGITTNGFWVEFDKASVPFEDGVQPKQLD